VVARVGRTAEGRGVCVTLRRYSTLAPSKGTVIPADVRREVRDRDGYCVCDRAGFPPEVVATCSGDIQEDHVRASHGIGMKSRSTADNLVLLSASSHRWKTEHGKVARPLLLDLPLPARGPPCEPRGSMRSQLSGREEAMTDDTRANAAAAPTREELIALIDQATVPQSEWHDRDSAGAQRQLGEGRALLLAGCDFTFDDPAIEHGCWWITVTYRGFDYFEIGEWSTDNVYIPTAERLAERAGKDWY
jgi:hypothetical protein